MLKDMDSGHIVVSSVRSGMKREFAMMMKSQLEMGELPVGRRMTRSQSSNRFCRRYVRRNVEMVKKVNMPKYTRKKQTEKGETKKGGNNEKGGGWNREDEEGGGGENGEEEEGDNDKEEIGENEKHKGEEEYEKEKGEGENDKDKGENITKTKDGEDVMDQDIVDVFSGDEGANADIAEVGSNVEEDSSSLGTELVSVKWDEQENSGIDLVGSFCAESTLLVEVVTNVGDDLKCLPANLLSVGGDELEKMGIDSRDDDMQRSCTLVQPAQVIDRSGDSNLEAYNSGRNKGCERTEESASEVVDKRIRRFTRSCLKLQDVDMESGYDSGMLEPSSALTSTSSPLKLEMKMSKKVELKRFPERLKDLLDTGLLEGLRVRYVHGSKMTQRVGFQLKGVIQGTGILCSCDVCKGGKVVTPNKFELHAHSGNKRPPDYIYLDNGRSLRDVLNACKANISDSLDQVILDAIGRSNYATSFCLNCKGIISEAGAGRSMLLCDKCIVLKETDASHTVIIDNVRPPLVFSLASVSLSHKREVVDGDQISSNSHRQLKRQGKLTRKDLRLHRSVFSEDILPDGTALSYFMHGKKRLEGVKKDGGIFCMCCNEVVSPSQFECHAGFAARRKPYMSIYTSNGVSLHHLSLELSKNRKPSMQENDDLCSICEDGGDLLCCENCPRAFHSECVGISAVPQGAWYCKYCQNLFEKEKFAEKNANAVAAGRIPGVDPLAEITQRCIRIVGTFAADVGGCAVCRGHGFSTEFNDRTVIICDQCEKEYHVGCLRQQNIDNLKALPVGEWFCCKSCSSINSALRNLVLDGELNLPEDLLTNLKNKFQELTPQQDPNPTIDIKWRLFSGKNASGDARVWLSGAVSIFHDRFDPITDGTGRLDLIPHMVYGRHFKDQDFCGMHCAILIVNSIVVSAAVFRIFGEEVAELPLVATRGDSQGKGYFQTLFFCIENLLASMGVKDLVVPAADEAESLWKNRFAFEKLGQEQLDKYKRSYQMMAFQGTSALHKTINKC